MSGYTKTGKKVKSICGGRTDLTYNKVYDVFIDSDGYEFIIDDVGHKRYVFVDNKNYYELVDDVAEATNTTNDIRDTNETKPKFKVGDKVKVVNIDNISAYTRDVYIGDIGTIININNNGLDPYQVKFNEIDKCCWWFTDECIELVSDVGDKRCWSISDDEYYELVEDVAEGDNTNNIENENSPIKSDGSQIVSDGGSSSYYAQQIPKGMLERFNTTGVIEAKDVIRLFLGNDFNMGNIFKAYCRVISLRNGKGKAGIDEQYDLTKAKYFTEDELNYYLENKDV